LIFGLKKLKQLLGKGAKSAQIECLLDSEKDVKKLNKKNKLKEKHIKNFFIEICNLMLDFRNVSFTHILREKNKIADGLVNEALDAQEKQNNLF
jgi:ribonuclease HI